MTTHAHAVPVFGCDDCRLLRDAASGRRKLVTGQPSFAGIKWPSWYTPTRDRRTQNRHVMHGLHPMGLRLLSMTMPQKAPGATCGDCAHRYSRQPSPVSTFFKCRFVLETGGPATDIRLKWPACEKWCPQTEQERGR